MNANELADIQAFKTEELTIWERNTTATMLRQQQEKLTKYELRHVAQRDRIAILEMQHKQQQAEIEALKDFAIWLTGCGYDFCQHEYFIKCRDELLIGKAQEK